MSDISISTRCKKCGFETIILDKNCEKCGSNDLETINTDTKLIVECESKCVDCDEVYEGIILGCEQCDGVDMEVAEST